MPEIAVGQERNLFNPNSMTFEERQADLKKLEEQEQDARKREKQSPYRKWYQFNLEHNKDMMWLARNAPKAHLTLLFLLEQMDNYNAVMCSYLVLCEALNISPATAKRAVKVLKDKGFIAVLKSGASNIYAVNDDLAWKSWGKNKEYSKFPANILLSASENADNTSLKAMKVKQIEIGEMDEN